jgi:signal transduction histidine kinase
LAPGRLRPRRWRLAAPVALCLLLAVAGDALAQAAPGGPATWRVVLLRSWDSLFPTSVAREAALRDALEANAPRLIEFHPEEIDPLRFPLDMDQDVVALLKRKYRDTPVDLVIASSLDPLEFVARHRDEIWPGAAVVFNGIYEGALEGWQRPKGVTGVMVQLDVEGTLALGRALVPGARKVYVVSGTSPYDRHLRDLVLRELEGLGTSLEIQRVDGLTREDTASTLASLQSDSLVLYVSMLRDASGKTATPAQPSISVVSGRSRVPVLSLIHAQFGRGPVGGSAPRFDAHGRAAGLLARRVLEGTPPDRIALSVEPAPACEVDWDAMQRWHVPTANVPAHCRIANQPPLLTRAYLWPIIGLIAVVLLQAALLAALVIQSRRRRRAEAELAARSAEMAQVARLSTIGALTASIAHEINQPMGAILSNAEAAEMMLDQDTLDAEKLREILADIRNEDLRASEVIRGLRRLLARNEWKPEPLVVNTEVAEALRHVAFESARRETRLAPVFGAEMPAVVGEAVQLQQVVINLVMNAMEAVAELPVAMREVRIETLARRDGVEILVADHGPGLSEDDAAKLFESAFTSKSDGMGFGLSIVQSIVDMHRGRVWFEPNVPRGAVFRVWLPAVGA